MHSLVYTRLTQHYVCLQKFWGVKSKPDLLLSFSRLRALLDGLDDAGVSLNQVALEKVRPKVRDTLKMAPADANFRKLGLLLAAVKDIELCDVLAVFTCNAVVTTLLDTLHSARVAFPPLSATSLLALVRQVVTNSGLDPTIAVRTGFVFASRPADFSAPRHITLLLGYLQSDFVHPSLDWDNPDIDDMGKLIENSRLLQRPTSTIVRSGYEITAHTEAALKLRMAFRDIKRVAAPLVHSWLRQLYPDNADYEDRFSTANSKLTGVTRPTDLYDTDTWDVYSVCRLLEFHATEIFSAHHSGDITAPVNRVLDCVSAIFPLRNDNGHGYVTPSHIARGIDCVADLLTVLTECGKDVLDSDTVLQDIAADSARSLRKLWVAQLVLDGQPTAQNVTIELPLTPIDEVFMRAHTCFSVFAREAHKLVKSHLQRLPVDDKVKTKAAELDLEPWAAIAFMRDSKTDQTYYHHACQWSIDVLVTQVHCLIADGSIGTACTSEKRTSAIEAAGLLTVLINEMRHDKDLETTWQLDACVKALTTLLDVLGAGPEIPRELCTIKTAPLVLPTYRLRQWDESHPSFQHRRTLNFNGLWSPLVAILVFFIPIVVGITMWRSWSPDVHSPDILAAPPSSHPHLVMPSRYRAVPQWFHGRTSELKRLESLFAHGQGQAHAIVTGVAGDGKTSLAAYFALMHVTNYSCVVWLDKHDYATVPLSNETLAKFTLCSGNALVLFDDVEDFGLILGALNNITISRLSVLATTRLTESASMARWEQVPLSPLSVDVMARILCKDLSPQFVCDANVSDVQRFIKVTDGLSLALHHANRLLRYGSKSLTQLVDDLEESLTALDADEWEQKQALRDDGLSNGLVALFNQTEMLLRRRVDADKTVGWNEVWELGLQLAWWAPNHPVPLFLLGNTTEEGRRQDAAGHADWTFSSVWHHLRQYLPSWLDVSSFAKHDQEHTPGDSLLAKSVNNTCILNHALSVLRNRTRPHLRHLAAVGLVSIDSCGQPTVTHPLLHRYLRYRDTHATGRRVAVKTIQLLLADVPWIDLKTMWLSWVVTPHVIELARCVALANDTDQLGHLASFLLPRLFDKTESPYGNCSMAMLTPLYQIRGPNSPFAVG